MASRSQKWRNKHKKIHEFIQDSDDDSQNDQLQTQNDTHHMNGINEIDAISILMINGMILERLGVWYS